MTIKTNQHANDIPDLAGKTAIVTGANSGIGFETVRALARKNAQVILACRSESKGQTAIEAIQKELPQCSVQLMLLDLADQTSIATFANNFLSHNHRLDLLINNAGVMALPQRQTLDGFEMQFGTNHLGHFALTARLLPALLATPGARIVTVSSTMHKMGKIDFDNLNAEKSYSKWGAYSQSKLANLLFAYELARKLAAYKANVISVAAHPGYSATNLQTQGAKMAGSTLQQNMMKVVNRLFAQSQAMGALPSLYAATAPDVLSGQYFGPRGFYEARGYPQLVKSSAAAYDTAVAAQLWQISEKLTHINYAEAFNPITV